MQQWGQYHFNLDILFFNVYYSCPEYNVTYGVGMRIALYIVMRTTTVWVDACSRLPPVVSRIFFVQNTAETTSRRASTGPTVASVSATATGCWRSARWPVTRPVTTWAWRAAATSTIAVTTGLVTVNVTSTQTGCVPTARGHVTPAVKVNQQQQWCHLVVTV